MGGELLFQVSPVPTIAELVQIALNVDFAEVVVGSFEESFCMRDSQTRASQNFVQFLLWNGSHLDVVVKRNYDMMTAPSVAPEPLSARLRLYLFCNYWFEIVVESAFNDLHNQVSSLPPFRFNHYKYSLLPMSRSVPLF